MKLTKKQTMPPAGLVEVRERMGWDQARLAEELGLLPAELAAMEAGAIAVPREVATILPQLELAYERQRILDESGLLACAEADALAAGVKVAFQSGDSEAAQQAVDSLVRHERRCGVCQARVEYLRVHGPPDPGPRPPLWMRGLAWIGTLADRLPRPLRPPPGPRGEYRRFGFVMGAYLTTGATLIIGSFAVLELVRGRRPGEDSALEMALILPVIAAAYMVGGYAAGAAWDATRSIRHRLLGYVARGAATAAALYGAMAIVAPFIDTEQVSPPFFVAMVAALTVFGGLVGAGKWLKDRWAHDVADPAADPSEGSAPGR